jgi:DNA-binding NtrC family response regulator
LEGRPTSIAVFPLRVGAAAMSVKGPSPVLVSWIAVANDPYERKDDGSFRTIEGVPVAGPTLAILTDPESEYRDRIGEVVLLRQGGGDDAARHERVRGELMDALRKRCPTLGVRDIVWEGSDPTDHAAIFEFLREQIPVLRRKFAGRELIIHVSPGTPSMHTVWVLMAETGFIEPPFRLVKSFRREHRRGRPVVVPVHIGIDTFYKRYLETRPQPRPADDQSLRWNPARFQSPALKRLFDEARRAAPLKIPVLLLGERGTGKTTLAGWIRSSSPYHKDALDRGWPAVPCGQYTPETMRAELFGYVKGSFTGAERDHDGLLHQADGDTLFLDEIGDISRDLQRLLIKALEEGQYLPIGAKKARPSDFRLLTATNLRLSELSKRLDADFFDRIGAYVLRLPPLRETPEDLDWMWDDVLVRAAQRALVDPRWAALPEKERSRLLAALKAHPLPGNLRDLFRVAWRYLAARADDTAPLPVSEAVDYALLGRDVPEDAVAGDQEQLVADQPKIVARAFADGRPIPNALLDAGPIRTKVLFAELRAYLTEQLRRLARESKRPSAEVADLTDRALRKQARKRGSGGAEP